MIKEIKAESEDLIDNVLFKIFGNINFLASVMVLNPWIGKQNGVIKKGQVFLVDISKGKKDQNKIKLW